MTAVAASRPIAAPPQPDAPAGGPGAGIWLRWSWRDLRGHWVAVLAIALVLAIGTGVYAGLTSTSTWRRASNDASFAATDLHDLRVATNPGTFVEQGALAALAAGIESASQITAVTERLVVPSQVDVDTDAGPQLVNATIIGGTVGADERADGPVDRVWVRDGSAPAVGSGDAVLELKFAEYHGLGPTGELRVAGAGALPWVGLGVGPEEFYVTGPQGTVLAEADLASLYLHLGDAQAITGLVGQVNEVVVTLADDADPVTVERQLREAANGLAGVGATVTDRNDVEAYRILYEDIDNDQQIFTALALLVLFAAALAAFNLISRIVEAQRREIGIGMALGVPRRRLAIRPLLIGGQIAVAGVVLGVGVGLLVAGAMKGLLESVLPMPDYRTPFQFATFAAAAALALAVPIAAAAWPVWRAVRVEPVEAIRTGHLTARPGRFTRLSKRIRLPGSSLNQIPMRAVLRTPRRTLLTAGGVGAAIAALVAVLGMLDSFERAIDRAGAEMAGGDPDRVLVQLDTFEPVDAPVVTGIETDPAVGRVDPVLVLPGTAVDRSGDDAFELIVEFVDLDGDRTAWSPTVVESGPRPADGIVLAEKAARDLGVDVGDRVTVRHPVRDGPLGFSLQDRTYEVTGIHPNPIRTFAFLDLDRAADAGFAGTTNRLHAYPADGATRTELQRALFSVDGVASTQAVARISEAFDDAMAAFIGFLVITAAFVLVLALLIAFNSTRITVEERRREHATMRAFGVPVRAVMATVMKESVVVGLLATVVGVAAGTWLLDWILRSLAARTLPDFGIDRVVDLGTVGIAAAIGVAAVTIAPLFLVRRITRMDLPSTLRVME